MYFLDPQHSENKGILQQHQYTILIKAALPSVAASSRLAVAAAKR